MLCVVCPPLKGLFAIFIIILITFHLSLKFCGLVLSSPVVYPLDVLVHVVIGSLEMPGNTRIKTSYLSIGMLPVDPIPLSSLASTATKF